MLALFLFAPLWGYISDRIGRRTVILIGLAGFSVAMVLFALAPDLVLIYSARALAGVFAVAVLPVVLALVGEMSTSRTRSQAFAWLSATSALGFMFGSMLSGLLASVTMVSTTVALMLPFYVAAGLSGLVWLAAYRFLPDSASRLGIKKESQRNAQSLLLVLSLLVMLGLGSFEVGMALLGQQVLSLQPREIGWMFIECSLVMILVQVFLLTPLIQRVGSNLLAPALMVMAVGIALLPYATSLPMMMMGIGLIAAASGLLITALTYLISLAAGSASGAALGKQTAAGSLGYAVGSSAAGWLFAVHIAIPFWITAGLLCLGAFAAFRASNNLKSIVRVEFNLKSERA
jgi:DHA1 family multidrug resistance protein-like MFS transporter